MPLVTMSLVPVTAAPDSKESGVTKVTYRWQNVWTGVERAQSLVASEF